LDLPRCKEKILANEIVQINGFNFFLNSCFIELLLHVACKWHAFIVACQKTCKLGGSKQATMEHFSCHNGSFCEGQHGLLRSFGTSI